MKTSKIIPLVLIIFLGIIFSACEKDPAWSDGKIKLKGKVVSAETGEGIPNVVFEIIGHKKNAGFANAPEDLAKVNTDDSGSFNVEIFKVSEASRYNFLFHHHNDYYLNDFSLTPNELESTAGNMEVIAEPRTSE